MKRLACAIPSATGIWCALTALLFIQHQPECPVSEEECSAYVHPSSVECLRASGVLGESYPFAQSCLYKHLYVVDGTPTLFVTSEGAQHEAKEVTAMLNRDDFIGQFRPRVIEVVSAESLCATHCIRLHDDLSVLGDFWLGNIGHALFDSLYSVFVSLIEHSNRHLTPFRLINTHTRRGASPFVEGVIGQAPPLGMVYADAFFTDNPEFDTHLMRELLIPNFARCISCASDREPIHFGMDMGHDLDALRLLREHVRSRFGMPPSPPRSSRTARSDAPLNTIAIDNKRFSDHDRHALSTALEISGPRIQGAVIRWEGMPFRDQLHTLSNTRIHLSGVGTACVNQPFLPDGAIHINLGACERYPYQNNLFARLFRSEAYTTPIPSYMEQALVAATPYHRALYYPLDELCNGLTTPRLRTLLKEAARLHDSAFPIPVPKGVNLAPTGRVVQALMRADPVFRRHLVDFVAHKDCATGSFFWPEIVLQTGGPWDAGGSCKLNVTMLRELKAQFLV